MTDIETLSPHIVITEIDGREQQMADLKHSLSEEGHIRDSRESDMAELKKELKNHTDCRDQQLEELKKQLGKDKTRICTMDTRVIGNMTVDMKNIATISNHCINDKNIKNLNVFAYEPKFSAYSSCDTLADEDCETLHDPPKKQCKYYAGDGVIITRETTYGRRIYTFTEDGVSLNCVLYKLGDCRMIAINNIVMPLREFLAVRHMKVKETNTSNDYVYESELSGMNDTIVCDTDTYENTMMLPRKQVITFEIKGASVQTLILAQIVLETVLYEDGTKEINNRIINNISKFYDNENKNETPIFNPQNININI